MRPLATVMLAATVTLLFAAPAAAQTAHVPADYSTIQAALNSGATLVYVAQGTYPETLDVQRTVTLLPEAPADPKNEHPFPHVAGMNVRHLGVYEANVYVRGFRFTGAVTQTNTMVRPGITVIEGCRLDRGFWTFGSSGVEESIKIRSCVITGDVYLYAYHNEFTGNTLWKGQADIHSNGGNGAMVRDNLVIGPNEAGLLSTSGDSPGLISGNTVTGVTQGISIVSGTATENVVEDCSVGFVNAGMFGQGRTFLRNTVQRCGQGFFLSAPNGMNAVLENTVDSSGTIGIHVGASVSADVEDNVVTVTGSHGIWNEGFRSPTGNRVLYAGGDGIRSAERADWNVVGRSHGNGITAPSARHNTVFLNDGAGLSLNSSTTDTVSFNISYGNMSYGLRWTGSGSRLLRCNDWYGNVAGATSGVSPGASDLAVLPGFCNLPRNDVFLSSSSPLLSASHCGQIGALGQGCFFVTDAPPAGTAPMKLSVWPNPSGSRVELRWSRTDIPSRIEVFDLSGAVRYRADVSAGVDMLRWSGSSDDGQPLPRGVYFVRRTSGSLREQSRVVLYR